MTVQQYSLVAHDWLNLEFIINDLASRVMGQELGTGSSPIWVGATLTGLTASRLVATDASSGLESSGLVSWVAGTTNQITVADDGDGSITLSTPQDLDTGTDFVVGSLTTTGVIDAHAGKVLVEDNDTVAPDTQSNGYIGVAVVDGTARLYFASGGTMYYIDGTAVEVQAIEDGNPMPWLFWFTYQT